MPRIIKEDIERWFEYGIYPQTRTIYLGGITHHDPGDDVDGMLEESGIYWNTARRIIQAIHLLDSNAQCGKKPITIIMNSCGGDWDHGMAIYNAIRYAKNHITIINMSHARSMTSIIFQAGDYRITSPDGFYMIHDGTTAVGDIPKSAFNTLDYEKNIIQPRMYQIYLDRLREEDDEGNPIVDIRVAADILNPKLPKGATKINVKKGVKGITISHIAQLCGQDTFFTSDEMIKLNFADRKLEENDLAGAYVNDDMHGLPTGMDSLEIVTEEDDHDD